MFLASTAKLSVPATSSPAVTFRVDPAITTGVPVGGLVAVNVSIEADPGAAIVGWTVDIKVDPNVLKPGYTSGDTEYVVKTGTTGYFLYDWCVATGWDPDPGKSPTAYIPGIKDETAGTINWTVEGIKSWIELGVGVGADGTGTLVTFYFTSKSETAYSPIEITKAYYYTSLKSPDVDKRVPDFIINGHYNEPLLTPVASFTWNPETPKVGEEVTFDASASYDPDGWIVSYAWDFGDGTSGSGITTTHAYTTVGTYTVTLTVTDNDGLTDTTSHAIEIKVKDPVEATQELIETIKSWNLLKGIEISLTSKLEEAILLFNKGNENGAIHKLMDFIDQAEALRDKKILTDGQANYLIAEAQGIIDLIKG